MLAGTSSHDSTVRFWDLSEILGTDKESASGSEEGSSNEDDDDDDDDDDSDSDSGDGGPKVRPDKRQKLLKQENKPHQDVQTAPDGGRLQGDFFDDL